MKDFSLYIHIPFCHHKCIYCDFYSLVNHKNIEPFFKALELEAEYFSELYGQDNQISTIFLGGGTPSMVETKYIGKLLDKIRSEFLFAQSPEITIESNPGTLTQKKLEEYRAIGINRLSIGVQSFNDDDLKFLTRIHSVDEAIEAIKTAERVGFDNISIDLMFSIPSQGMDIWKENLETAVSLPVSHISAYSLTLERGTPLFYQVENGLTQIHSIEHDADNYELTMDFLASKGFVQYEVSNFAKDGKICRHNLNYWSRENYLGFGPSSHSFWTDIRWANYSALSRYLAEIDKKQNAIMREEVLTPSQQYNERIFLSLRSTGLDLKKFREDFAVDLYESEKSFIEELNKGGFILLDNNFMKLTSKGYLLCDEICQQLTI